MIRRPTVHEPFLWLKCSALLISWTLFALVLIIVTGNNELELSTIYLDFASLRPDPDLRPPKNTIKAFNYCRWDPKGNNRHRCSLRFENLYSENNKLGFFNTALHKVVKIQDLELKFYRYSSDKATAATTPDISPVPDGITTDTRALVKRIMHRLTTPADGWRVDLGVDLGNVSEVRVNNLDYRVFHDDNLFFATQSKRAIVSYEHSDIVLHGHAKITIADGSTLESNYIKWDVKKQHFSVKGVYVLNRGGAITTGKGICVDAQLKSVNGQYAKSERKEQKCIAKL